VNTVSRVAEVPVALAVLLGMLAAAALVQTLLTTVRRRRRDLAILATLGLTRPQLRRVVMFQGTTLALIGLMLGLPAGLASGRWAWGVFANEIGVLPRPATPPVLLLALGVGMLVFAALVALVPAHLASRVRPAVVLRTE
jgi:ABC-type lipoprotein release transport system permease subunit